MKNLVLAQRYAKALDRIAKSTDEAAANLISLEESLGKLKEFSPYLKNPTISGQIKSELIEKALPNNIAKIFLLVLIQEKRFDLLEEIIKQLYMLLDIRRGVKRGKVFTATELDNTTKEQIKKELENYFKSDLTLDFKEDKSLISGLKIKVDDFYIEDSSASRLRELEERLRE